MEINNKNCLVEQAMKEAKDRGEPNLSLCLSCPCPKCSPRC